MRADLPPLTSATFYIFGLLKKKKKVTFLEVSSIGKDIFFPQMSCVADQQKRKTDTIWANVF